MQNTLDLSQLKPGFTQPTLEAQALFRRVLDAMSRPGTVQDLSAAPEPPAGLNRATAGIALTLLDFETPLWLDPTLHAGETASWLRFHCGCPFVEDPRQAAFAIIADAARMPALAMFNRGDEKYPDRSTTVILQAAALSGGAATTVAGPGIADTRQIRAVGLVADFWQQMRDNGSVFQLGVDVMLTADAQMIGLPRTVRPALSGAATMQAA